MATRKKREEKVSVEEKFQKKDSLFEGGSILANRVLEPYKAILDAHEAKLKPNQTNEERYRAYPNPKKETKSLKIF